MLIFFILLMSVSVIFLGRLMFGKWFDHVSLYTGIWGGALILFELRLINYYPLETRNMDCHRVLLVTLHTWFLFSRSRAIRCE